MNTVIDLTPPNPSPLDDDTLAFAQKVFQMARQGDHLQLADLLDQGLPANIRNQTGDSLLMLVTYHGHLNAARVLLEYGANPELANDHGQTPLAGAAFKGDMAMVQLLLDYDADVEGVGGGDGKTALMYAAMFNRTQIAELLIARGADMDATDAGGMTALMLANSMGALDTAQLIASLSA